MPVKRQKKDSGKARGMRFPPELRAQIMEVKKLRRFSTFTNAVIFLVELGLEMDERKRKAEQIGEAILEKEEIRKTVSGGR